MSKGWLGFALLLALAGGMAGCSNGGHGGGDAESGPASEKAAPAVQAIRLEVAPTVFPLKQWREDGSHETSVKGKLLIGDQPVANAVIHAGDGKRNILTREDGSFELSVDQSLLADMAVRVVSLEGAMLNGEPIQGSEANDVLAAASYISVFYPIQVRNVRASALDASKVDVQGHIVTEQGDVVSYFQIDKYRIGGTVKDADGLPVKDAAFGSIGTKAKASPNPLRRTRRGATPCSTCRRATRARI